jgi:quinol monooxygenase YgiN
MIKVIAKNFIKEDKVEDFIAKAKELVQATTQNDAGCLRYELFQDLKNPQILTIMEEWESNEALGQHMASKHFKEILPLMAGFSEKPGETNLYQKLV